MKKIFIFIMFLSMCLFAPLLPVKAVSVALDMIVTSPGEDSSTQMRISWHSSTSTCTFSYTTNDDTSFTNATTKNVSGVFDDYTFAGVSYYRYKVELEDLTPNTNYIYTVKSGTTTSTVHSFKTGSDGGTFSFIWDSDTHAYTGMTSRISLTGQLIKYAERNLGETVPLIISTGDEVAYGAAYGGWQQWFNPTYTDVSVNTIRASVVGNHTYYTTSSVITTNAWWLSIYNVPKNGLVGNEAAGINALESCFWYIYNGVLFVGIDSIIANKTPGYTTAERVWFENVMKANAGKYQYSVVYQHYPWFDGESGSSHSYSNNFESWHDLFDKYGVDLALGGDKHCYLRTKSIYNTSVVEDGSKGTVYINAPQIGDRFYTIVGNENANLMAKRIDSPNLANNSGLSYFTVTSEGITQTLIDCDNVIQDTSFIPAKREVVWKDKKADIENSISVSTNGSKAYIDFLSNCTAYVEKVEVIKNNNIIATANPSSTGKSSIELNNLNNNDIFDATIKITYVDNTVKTIVKPIVTYYFGEIYGFKTKVNNNKLSFSWNHSLSNDIVKEFKIFQNDTSIATLTPTATSYEIDMDNVNINDSFTLKAFTSDGKVVYNKTIQYNLYGDINFDGTVNNDDLMKFLDLISKNTEFSANEIELLDVNFDGVADSGDAITLLALIQNKISDYKYYEYTVIYIDDNGKILSENQVRSGNNVTAPSAPNKSGYTFSHWSISSKAVDCNLIIRPIYEESK